MVASPLDGIKMPERDLHPRLSGLRRATGKTPPARALSPRNGHLEGLKGSLKCRGGDLARPEISLGPIGPGWFNLFQTRNLTDFFLNSVAIPYIHFIPLTVKLILSKILYSRAPTL